MAGAGRRLAAALLVVTAVVHVNLYTREQYHEIPTVGWLFLLTVVSATLLAVSVVVVPGRLVDVSAALFALSVLGGYVFTLLLPHGLFNFKEPGVSYSGAIAIAAELGTALSLVPAIRRGIGRHRSRTATPAASGPRGEG